MKILILGDGLLGSELRAQTGWDYVSRKKGDFNLENWEGNMITIPNNELYDFNEDTYISTIKYDVIVNCIANTNTYSDDKDAHWNVNYKFVDKLINFCNSHYKLKLVHISTDYIYAGSDSKADEETTIPIHNKSWYSYTKLLADGLVQLRSSNYLLCRTSFKPTPFPYENAWGNQLTNANYVDFIANKIILLIEKECEGVYNVGGEILCPHTLAKRTNPDVGMIDKPDNAPFNVTMNISKLKNDINDKLD